MENQENMIPEEDLDLVEFEDEEGNVIQWEVLRYFFYNGDEFVVLGELHDCDCEDCEEEEERNCVIMKVEETANENGEEMEDFLPIEDDDLYNKLIEVAEANFADDEAFDE